jgi:Protein of unknown function (DUF3810)
MRDYQLARALDEEAFEEVEEAREIEETIGSPRRWTEAVIVFLGALGIQRLASLMPEMVERIYSNFFYYYLARIVSAFNKLVGVSLAEIGLVILIVALLLWLAWLVQKAWNGFINPFELLLYLLYRGLWAGGIGMILFFVLWGFNYQRLPVGESLKIAGTETQPGELESICNQMISRLNENYQLVGVNQNPASESVLPITTSRLYQVIEQSYQRSNLLGNAGQGGFGAPKPLFLSGVLTRLGISGVFSPFTGEANYNQEVPPSDLPFVIAHEKAHQRGWAREDEASFIAFVVCTNSGDPFVRYAGYLQAVPKLMQVLRRTNEPEYNNLKARIADGPRNDLASRAQFWTFRENPILGAAARQTNNTYLRANRVRSGIANYDEVTSLIIGYYQRYPNGDSSSPAPLVNDPPMVAGDAATRPRVSASPFVSASPVPMASPLLPADAPRDNGFIP